MRVYEFRGGRIGLSFLHAFVPRQQYVEEVAQKERRKKATGTTMTPRTWSRRLFLLATWSMSINCTAFVHRTTFLDFRSTSSLQAGDPICEYRQVNIATTQEGHPRQAISVEDLTPILLKMLQESGMKNGVINIISRHTTTAITINERESRLAKDMQEYFLKLAPPDERSSAVTAKANVRYYHNDIDQRPDSDEEAQRCRDNGWEIDDPTQLQAWRDQEPINAHSHLLSMLLGSSESIPVLDGKMVLGQWQSVLLVDLDGPRDRTVGVQFLGYQ